MVLAHELGHFLLAKRNGIGAEEFGFGFPPRIVGIYKDEKGRRKIVWGNRSIEKIIRKEDETVYSLNLIPIGGFVKITGEDGPSADEAGQDKKNPKSFAGKNIWTRFKILFAGVGMNFLLGIFLLAAAFQIGLPEAVEDSFNSNQTKIQITQIAKNSPAQKLGLKMGDELIAIITENKEQVITSTQQFQEVISQNAGKEVTLKIKHFNEEALLEKTVNIRQEAPEGEGLLGVVLVKTIFKQYGFFESFWIAVQTVFSLVLTILAFLGDLIISIFTEKPVSADIAGPIGIAVLTGQVAQLGLAYILQFAALLSVNLAIINLLPFPALDGGRIIFLLIEKIKGSPVSQKAEGIIHTAGFFFLISLMILITVKDFINFEIADRLKSLF